MREGHIAIFRYWTTHWSYWDWLGFSWNGSFHAGGEGRRGRMETCESVCECLCVLWFEGEYKWDNVFTTERGCERKNWPSTELWFHFGDIESLDQTSEATKEQFSVPITAHSSWRDCCVAFISPVGGGRAAAESLHKNSSPVAPGPRETACTCVCLCERLEYLWVLSHQHLCAFVCFVHSWHVHLAFAGQVSLNPRKAVTSPLQFHKQFHRKEEKKTQAQNRLSLYRRATQAMCL